ncbi:hypothetical protein JCM10213v2_005650 [Rhodosporidiobolus nylandii]
MVTDAPQPQRKDEGGALGMALGQATPERQKELGMRSSPAAGANEARARTAPPLQPKESEETDELALLVVSSSITELAMSIQEINTLIFEIQELRHTTSSASTDPQQTPKPPSNGFSSSLSPSSSSTSLPGSTSTPSDNASALSEVDAALIRLDAKLDAVRAEFATVEAQVKPLIGGAASAGDAEGELVFVRQKWAEMLGEWESAQQDAEGLNDELKEDKWLVVFRTVSQQAEDMMRSLEKVLAQCERQIEDAIQGTAGTTATSPLRLPRSPSAPLSSLLSGSYFPDSTTAQTQLASFSALQKSLTAKVTHYSPACSRVLKILDKGISDRSTKNGEVLRRYGEMKARWRNLRERIQRVEAEMKAVEAELREKAGAAGQASKEPQKARTRQSEYGDTLTPPRPDVASPGRASPIRRLTNTLSPDASGLPAASTPPSASSIRRAGLPPSASSPSLTTARSATSAGNYDTLRASTSSSRAGPTPPRPPKSVKRLVSDSQVSSPAATPPRTPQALAHRRSASMLSTSVPSSATSSVFGTRAARPSLRPISPTPNDAASRPRWNVSTKRTDEERETLSQQAMGKGGRLSIGGAYPPSASKNGRHSAMGLRPSSRMSLSSSMSRSYGLSNASNRPVSPAFSDASSAMHRERPSTPGSRIPVPSSATRRSHTPFSSLDDSEPTSLLQRAVSPTPGLAPPSSASRPSHGRWTAPSTSSRSRLSTHGALSPPRATSPAFSTSSALYRGQTPEPSLIAHAQRLAHVRAPPSASRPPPVPRVPNAYRNSLDPQTTPRAGSSGTFGGPRPSLSRPPSVLSNGRFGAVTPLPSAGATPATDYVSNPHDPLDQAVSTILMALPLLLHVSRVDPPLSRAQAAQAEVFQARYQFSLHPLEDSRRAVMCKLVDRLGPRAKRGEKKVLARVGGGWQDLEAHLLSLLATTV